MKILSRNQTSDARRITPFMLVLTIALVLAGGCADEWVDKPVDLKNANMVPVSLDEDGNVVSGLQSIGQLPMSADGRFVVYYGLGKDQDEDDGTIQVYLVDVETGSATIVSRNEAGQDGDRNSHAPSVDEDGDTVAFVSFARNLPNDLKLPKQDIYDPVVYIYESSSDRVTSADAFSQTFVNLSGDGKTACFIRNNYPVCMNLSTNQTTVMSLIDDELWTDGVDDYQFMVPIPNRDGTILALVTDRAYANQDDNSLADIYVVNINDTVHPELVSVRADGSVPDCESFSPVLSADANRVAFVSCSALGDPDGSTEDYTVYVYDRTTKVMKNLVVENPPGTAEDDLSEFSYSDTPSISGDGRFVSFEQFCDGEWTIYVWDLSDDSYAPAVSREIVDPAEFNLYRGAFNNRISADGSRILFVSYTRYIAQWSKNTIYTAPNPLFEE